MDWRAALPVGLSGKVAEVTPTVLVVNQGVSAGSAAGWLVQWCVVAVLQAGW